MRTLTNKDLASILGSVINGYRIEGVRVKHGNCSDSDNYGYVLGRDSNDSYVVWEFYLDDDDKPNTYWGYYTDSREAAVENFNNRDSDDLEHAYKVTIIETLKREVEVQARSQEEAVQMVSDKWKNSEYVLSAEDFEDVDFTAAGNAEE